MNSGQSNSFHGTQVKKQGIPGFDSTVAMAPHFDRWLSMALDNHAGELSLVVLQPRDRNPDILPCSITGRILFYEFIKSLSLAGDVEIDGISDVSLPSLRIADFAWLPYQRSDVSETPGGLSFARRSFRSLLQSFDCDWNLWSQLSQGSNCVWSVPKPWRCQHQSNQG